MKLLIDEHLSPRLAIWCAERRGIHAVAVPHVGLAGSSDAAVLLYAYEHDFIVVTTNVRDFMQLLESVDLHPGLIVIREGGLTRDEQWIHLARAPDFIADRADRNSYMVNRVLDVISLDEIRAIEMPTA